MASITGAGGFLEVDDPFIYLDPDAEGAKRVSVAATFGGAVVVEYTIPRTKRTIRLRLLRDAERAILNALLNSGGVVTVSPGDGSSFTAVLGDRKEHAIEPYNGPHPPSGAVDSDALDIITESRADLVLYLF